MSLKIPELQVMLPRASEISRTQQVQLQENAGRQQELASQMANQSQKAQNSVNKSPANEEALIHDQKERKNKRESERQKAGKNSDQKDRGEIQKPDLKNNCTIDILV